jgi:hypothetical protein
MLIKKNNIRKYKYTGNKSIKIKKKSHMTICKQNNCYLYYEI